MAKTADQFDEDLTEILTDLVTDEKCSEASSINNMGQPEQLRYLAARMGRPELDRLIESKLAEGGWPSARRLAVMVTSHGGHQGEENVQEVLDDE